MKKLSFAKLVRIPVMFIFALTLLVGVQPVSAAEPSIQGTSPTSLTVLAPNGGEVWTAGESRPITWTSVNPGGHLKIQLLQAGVVIRTLTDEAHTIAGSFNWRMSTSLASGADYSIKITSTSNPAVTDTSDAYFEIVALPPPTVTVTSPNGGEVWTAGESHPITWTSVNPGGHLKIQLLQAGVVIRTLTDEANTSEGSFNWHMSSTLASGVDYSIRITSTSNALVTDESDAYFEIVALPPPTVTVTSPNGGEVWTAGESHPITWTSVNPGGHLKIQLLQAGVVIRTLTDEANTSTGSFMWHMSSTLASGVDYSIRITSTSNALVTDESDAYFEIVALPPPTVTVTSPNGGEVWTAGESHPITWTSVNPGGHLKIQLLQAGVVIRTLTDEANTSTGSFMWHMSSTLASGVDYSIRITNTNDALVTDESDAYFEIVALPPPTVTLTSPNGGEVWTAGESHPITWTSVNPGGHLKIQLLQAGLVIRNLTDEANTSTGSFMWHMSSTLASGVDYSIRITNTNDALVTDESAYFQIVALP